MSLSVAFSTYPHCVCGIHMVPFLVKFSDSEYTGWKCTSPKCGKEIIPDMFKAPKI